MRLQVSQATSCETVSYTHLKGADGESAASHEYGYDALMRPVQRRDSWDGTTPATTRNFTGNSRSERVEDRISQGGSFSYQYDNIGNRKTARELDLPTLPSIKRYVDFIFS